MIEKRHQTWPDGRLYDGEWLNDQPHGQGMLTYADGGQYWGRFVHGKRQGEGLMKFVNGDEYEGHWFDDQPHGQGTLMLATGGRYEGEFSHGKPAGKGRKYYPDGTYYDGQWKQGVPHGFGRLTFTDGGAYEGQFDKGKPHGHGLYFFVNGDLYEGEWYQGQQRGKGRFDYATGGWYEGDVLDGKRHGRGVLTTALGQRFEGRFVNNEPDGAGQCGTLGKMSPCHYLAGKRITKPATNPTAAAPAPALAKSADVPVLLAAATASPPPMPLPPQSSTTARTTIKSAIPSLTTPSKAAAFTQAVSQAKQEWKKRSLTDLDPTDSDIDFNHQGALASLRTLKGRVWFNRKSSLFQDNLEIVSQHGSTQMRLLIEDYKGPGQYAVSRVVVTSPQQRFSTQDDEPGIVRIVADNDGWISGEFSFKATSENGTPIDVRDGVFRISAASQRPSFFH